MSKHTPGPLAVFRPGRWGHEGIYDWTVVSVARDRAICDGDGDNAQLIAAAPDLLNACRIAAMALAAAAERDLAFQRDYESVSAAIEKARGEA